MIKKGIGFGEGFLLLLLLLFIDALLQYFGRDFYHSFLSNPIAVTIPYLIIFWIISVRKKGLYKTAKQKSSPRLGLCLITLSLFLFTTFLLELEAILNLGIEQYLNSFNKERGLDTNFITILLIIPVLEEVFFRGILFKGFSLKYGQTKGVIFSSILFTIIHIDTGVDSTFTKVITALVLGILLCYILIYTGNIRFTIFIHILWNTLNYIKGIAIVIFDVYFNDIWDYLIFSILLVVAFAIVGIIGMKKVRIYYGQE